MWSQETIEKIKKRLLSLQFTDMKIKTMYEYLFLGGPFVDDDKYYRFIIVSFKKGNHKPILKFFNELFHDSFILEIEDNYVLFYKEQQIDDIKNLMLSVMEDFSLPFRVFVSSKISSDDPKNFYLLYKAYCDFLNKDYYAFSSNKELIFETFQNSRAILKELRPIILNNCYNDHQIILIVEALINNDLNISQAANEIYLHRNTVNNKIDLVYQETQLNIKHFSDVLAMYLLNLDK